MAEQVALVIGMGIGGNGRSEAFEPLDQRWMLRARAGSWLKLRSVLVVVRGDKNVVGEDGEVSAIYILTLGAKAR